MIQIYDQDKSAAAYELRDFLHRNATDFDWHPAASDAEAKTGAGLGPDSDAALPICILNDGEKLLAPTTRQLAEKLQWFHTPRHNEYDLAIYGAGPAGLSAAVYGASEGLRTLLIERSAVGGQAGSTSRIENYLGFPDGISGWELASRARDQAQRLGAEILLTGDGVAGGSEDGWGICRLASGEVIRSRASICATGVEYRRLGLPEEERFLNRGVYYGAGASEAALCQGEVFVVGGGNSAGQAALFFAGRTEKVTILIRGEQLSKTLSSYLIDRIRKTPNIYIQPDSELVSLSGDRYLEEITFRNIKTDERHSAKTAWVFVCIGGVPRTDWAKPGSLLTDKGGYVLTGADLAGADLCSTLWMTERRPSAMESSLPGLFVAGDVRHNAIKRCAIAVGEGAQAVALVQKYLELPEAARPCQ